MDSVLTTDRLILRPWQAEDAPRLFDIRRRPEVAQWLGDPTPWSKRSQADDAIADWGALEPPMGVWALLPGGSDVPAGSVSLKYLPGDREVEIGWALHPDSLGKGYASEGARAVLAYAFASGVPTVWAVMWAHNEPSAAVATAIGMRRVGVRPDPWYGTPEDPDSLFFRAGPPGIVVPAEDDELVLTAAFGRSVS